MLLGGRVESEGLALFLTRMPVTKCVQSVQINSAACL